MKTRWDNLIRAGAVLEVTAPDGRGLGEHPVDWMMLDEAAGTLAYSSVGEEEREHWFNRVQVQSTDGVVVLKSGGGYTFTLGVAWQAEHRRIIREWLDLLDAGVVVVAYPEGAVRLWQPIST